MMITCQAQSSGQTTPVLYDALSKYDDLELGVDGPLTFQVRHPALLGAFLGGQMGR